MIHRLCGAFPPRSTHFSSYVSTSSLERYPLLSDRQLVWQHDGFKRSNCVLKNPFSLSRQNFTSLFTECLSLSLPLFLFRASPPECNFSQFLNEDTNVLLTAAANSSFRTGGKKKSVFFQPCLPIWLSILGIFLVFVGFG